MSIRVVYCSKPKRLTICNFLHFLKGVLLIAMRVILMHIFLGFVTLTFVLAGTQSSGDLICSLHLDGALSTHDSLSLTSQTRMLPGVWREEP